MRPVLIAVALVSACQRDFILPPPRPKVEIEPAAATVAPREKLQLTAEGGQPPYQFVFAEGGRNSGDDAEVFAATGLYQAGRRGLAADVVEVFDAGGKSARARITVSAPMQLSPQFVDAAPGDPVDINISGGKPPYSVSVSANASGGVLFEGEAPVWEVGDTGDGVDILEVRDATYVYDPENFLVMAVDVGQSISLFAPGGGDAAPHGTLDFIATGGRPPYLFDLVEDPSGGSVDPDTGRYRAGGVGNVTDVVRVTDVNEKYSEHQVDVGPALALRLENPDLRPGVTTQLIASGGRPPYAFGFGVEDQVLHKGNRSDGEVDAMTGAYTPGFNFGAEDVLEVRDATGIAVARIEPPVPVGPPAVPLGNSPRMFMQDLNTDGRDDLVVISPFLWSCRNCLGRTRIAVALARPARAHEVTEYFFPPLDPLLDAVVVAGGGDGRAKVAWMTETRVGFYVAALDGRLEPGGVAFTRPPAVEAGAFTAVAMEGDVHVYFGEGEGSLCDDTEPRAGIGYVRWQVDAAGPDAPVCAVKLDTGDLPLAIATADYDGDGALDLAWVGQGTQDRVGIARAPAFAPAEVMLPAGYTFAPSYHGAGALVAAEADPATPGTLFVMARAAGGAEVVAVDARNEAVVGAPYAPPGPAPTVLGRWADGATLFVNNGFNGALARFSWTAAGGFEAEVAPAPLRFGVDAVAFGDTNGDGIADLAATGGSVGNVEVLFGDADGGIGRMRHVTGLAAASAAAVADVDGDGLGDVVSLSAAPALEVRFGGDHQLAVAPRMRLEAPAFGLAVGDFDGDEVPDVAYQLNAGGLRVRPGAGDGAFGDPQPVLDGEGNEDLALVTSLRPARLGGEAPGVDLAAVSHFPFDADGREPFLYTGIVFSAPLVAERIESAPLWSQGGACRFVTLPMDGDALDDVVAACFAREGGVRRVKIYRASASRAGGTLSFGAWALAHDDALAAGENVFAIVGAVGGAAAFATRPAGGPPRLVLVGPAESLRYITLPAAGIGGTAGRLNADAVPDFAVSLADGRARLFFGNSNGTFSAGPDLAAAAPLYGALALALDENGGPLPADLLFRAGDDVVILENEGFE